MKRLALALVALLGLSLFPAGIATAREDDVIRNGGCSRSSTWTLKLSPENGRTEVEFEVDQNRNGVRWRVVLRRNGTVVVTTRATTRAPSGSFSVERRLANPAGSDTISARATSPSGEVCTARLTI